MNEPALTEAVKTDLPSPKPNRRRRLVLRFAALVAAVSALGAAYWFTRPPELVWWRSPAFGANARHIRLLVPRGWVPENDPTVLLFGEPSPDFTFQLGPTDLRPEFLKRVFPVKAEKAYIAIEI